MNSVLSYNFENQKCTHMVIESSQTETFPLNYLQAILYGKWIVGPDFFKTKSEFQSILKVSFFKKKTTNFNIFLGIQRRAETGPFSLSRRRTATAYRDENFFRSRSKPGFEKPNFKFGDLRWRKNY